MAEARQWNYLNVLDSLDGVQLLEARARLVVPVGSRRPGSGTSRTRSSSRHGTSISEAGAVVRMTTKWDEQGGHL